MGKTLVHPDERIGMRHTNRRLFPRFPFECSIGYVVCSHSQEIDLSEGYMRNVSQGGMLVTAHKVPPISSIIIFETPLTELSHCIDVESLMITPSKHLLGKVVHVGHHKHERLTHIGVTFIKKSEKNRSDVINALSRFPRS